MDNKELTLVMLSFFMEKKVSIKNIMETFELSEEDAKQAINELINKNAIYNYDFTKSEMDYISKDQLDNLIKITGKSKSELYEKYCVFNPKMSIDGTLKEYIPKPLNEKTKLEILNIALDVGVMSASIIQIVLQLGYSNACQYLDWMEEHNYIDDANQYHNVLISIDKIKELYPQFEKNNVPLNLFKAFYDKERYEKYLEMVSKDKALEKIFYRNMETVSFEDIMALNEEDFNIIPSGWLYDWEKITGCNSFDKIEKRIKKRKEKGIDI